jgi:hypothetical protein
MLNLKKLGFAALMLFGTTVYAEDRLYVDSQDLDMVYEAFHIRLKDNVWIETNTIHRDETGLYANESDIVRVDGRRSANAEYVQKWQCPYCFKFWPIGVRCQNAACPSKYQSL